MRTKILYRWLCAAISIAAANVAVFSQVAAARLYSVEVSAIVQTSPPRITLQWPADLNATGYTVSKLATNGSWQQLGTLPGSATQFNDSAVAIGDRIEYQILKSTTAGYVGSGYIVAGINAPAVEQRGKIILLVDGTFTTSLSTELKRLEQDLVGDGWTVLRRDILRTTPVPQVKAIIQDLYYSDPGNVRALFLFGHIAVPYSGDFTADSHQNHRGAWPADAFYGDMDGSWTDSTVTSVNAEKSWNHNRPGDGKFDQSDLPSDVELEIGRVDLFNMTCFANKAWSRNEEYLLRQYLEKDHRFRHGLLPLPRRGLIIDNFEADGEALASSGWRAFAPMFGAASNRQVPWGTYFSTLNSEGYLWSYGNGGGSYYTCAGIGGSDDFALNDIKVVFTFFFGSYYGDWDNESNFLRAPLGSTSYTLASSWGSRPHWFVHPMALGETIGYATKLTQNNDARYEPLNIGTRMVHTALHGDPTLRMHPVIPPSGLTVAVSSGISLGWSPSTDSNIVGYHIYRGTSETGPWTRITANPSTATTFNDASGTISHVYMVRAMKLESSASGTYFNLSQGIFGRAANPPAPPTGLSASVQSGGNSLSWTDNSANETGFRIYRKVNSGSYAALATVGANVRTFVDASANVQATNTYSVAAYNAAGESSWSSPVTLIPPTAASARFVGTDSVTGGSWKNVYGADGYNIIQNSAVNPPSVAVTASGNSSWVWNSSTADPAALLRAGDNTRLAACWYSATGFDVQFDISDNVPHRVSFYFLDWDHAGRKQVIEIFHSDSGALLATRTLEAFHDGIYVTFDLQGRVTMRIRPLVSNAVLSGIFFDPAVATVAVPTFSPAGGTFTNAVSVALNTATAGATIRYTTNGTTPSSASQAYVGPIPVTATSTIKARAFLAGMADSSVATATYTIVAPPDPGSTSVTFNGANTSRGGNWKGNVGSQGHLVVADSQSLPSYVSLSTMGKADWTWAYTSTESRALQRNTLNSRLAACWYASGSFEVELNFSDNQEHRVSFYCLDWDRANREQKVEILDYASRQVLHSYTLSNFGNGAYLDYSLKGRFLVRFTRLASFNAVLSGIFFDAP